MRSKEAVRLRIMQLCGEYDLTLNGMSTVCGVTQSTLNNIVSGRNNSVSIITIQKICEGLQIDLPAFFNTDLFRDIEQEVY